MDPQQFDPGNSARRLAAPRPAFKGDTSLPRRASRASRWVHFLRAESHDRLPSAVRSPVGKVPRARRLRSSVRRELQPAAVDTSRGRGRLRRMTSVPGAPRPFPDLRVTASSVRGNRGAGATRPGSQVCAKGRWRIGRCSTRPVLKHGPRSLTCARVTGTLASKPTGATKVRGASGPFPGRIPSRSRGGRTAGPSQRHRSRGGARAHTLGPERW